MVGDEHGIAAGEPVTVTRSTMPSIQWQGIWSLPTAKVLRLAPFRRAMLAKSWCISLAWDQTGKRHAKFDSVLRRQLIGAC